MLIAIIVIGLILVIQLNSIRNHSSYNKEAFYEMTALRGELQDMKETLKYSLMRIDDNTQ